MWLWRTAQWRSSTNAIPTEPVKGAKKVAHHEKSLVCSSRPINPMYYNIQEPPSFHPITPGYTPHTPREGQALLRMYFFPLSSFPLFFPWCDYPASRRIWDEGDKGAILWWVWDRKRSICKINTGSAMTLRALCNRMNKTDNTSTDHVLRSDDGGAEVGEISVLLHYGLINW